MTNFVALGELCTKITKGTTPAAQDGGFSQAGINYLKSESLSYEGSIDVSKFAFISKETHIRLRRSEIQKDDVLYSIAGANLGKCAVARPEHLPANTNQAVAIIRVDPKKADARYISYCLRDNRFVQSVLAGVAQSAQPNVNLGEISRFKVPRRELVEQKAIAATLGALDNKVELNRRTNETLEAAARALFKDWFVDFGPTRAKMEGREPYLADDIWSLFPESFDNDGMPSGWKVESLLTHANLISGGTPKTSVRDYWGGNIAWASAKDVSQCADAFLISTARTITDRGLAESSTRAIPKFATTLVARGATTGRSCILGRDMAMNQTCYALTSKKAKPFWVNCAFGNLVEGLVQAAHGSVFDTITTKTIERSSVVIPSNNLIAQFEHTVTPLFLRLLANVDETQVLTAARDYLLPKLMSGEMQVREASAMVGVKS